MDHAHRFSAPGDPSVLHFEPVTLSPPEPEQVRIRQHAIGVNYIDIYHRSGLYPVPGLPSGLGLEGAGVIEAVGAEVFDLSVGERVGYVGGPLGAYATARNLPRSRVVKLPVWLSFEEAAAVLLKGMTVEMLVRRVVKIEPGQVVLLHAAAGGVGLLACAWLRHLGARVIGGVSTAEKAKLARAHGADEVILTETEDFGARVRELTDGRGVDVVFDSVGRTTLHRSLECLRRRGTLVSFGNASGKPAPLEVGSLGQLGSLTLTRPSLFDYIATPEELGASSRALFELLAGGQLPRPAPRCYPLADAASVHRALESRATTGALVLTP